MNWKIDIIDFKSWIEHIQFKLKEKYKIINITYDDYGLRIIFETNFMYRINTSALVELRRNNTFEELCDEIENLYLKQILNV